MTDKKLLGKIHSTNGFPEVEVQVEPDGTVHLMDYTLDRIFALDQDQAEHLRDLLNTHLDAVAKAKLVAEQAFMLKELQEEYPFGCKIRVVDGDGNLRQYTVAGWGVEYGSAGLLGRLGDSIPPVFIYRRPMPGRLYLRGAD